MTVTRVVRLADKPHCKLRVQLRYWAIDSWDGELGTVNVDNDNIYSMSYSHGQQCSGGGWNSYGGTMPNPWNNDRTVDKCYQDIDKTVDHTASMVTLSFRSTIDQDVPDESFAISNLVVTTIPC